MKVVIYGFGQIGRMLAEMCIKKGFELIEVIDINPSITTFITIRSKNVKSSSF